MTYNVLGYGDGCQGDITALHQYLGKIVTFARPDILGLVKTASIKSTPGDIYGLAPYGFADSIIAHALNPSFPGRFNYCPFTNTAYSDKISLLFYNQQKLGYVSTTLINSYITDFDLYKLYYKDAHLQTTKDTTFLYVLLNHTQSGSDPAQRNMQAAAVIAGLTARFHHLPNLINMGDFNTRNSQETGYYSLTQGNTEAFRFTDPPFHADSMYHYPANWSSGAGDYSACLTTSTRALANVPNTCGTDGGAKGWYDHILLAPWIVDGSNYTRYIRGSYHTIGNDGHRLGLSVNDSMPLPNTSAPAGVIDALFRFSNKYPVMLSLEMMPNTTGQSPADPEINAPTGIGKTESGTAAIQVLNPVYTHMSIVLTEAWLGKTLLLSVSDMNGRKVMEQQLRPDKTTLRLPFGYAPGIYSCSIYDALQHRQLSRNKIVKF